MIAIDLGCYHWGRVDSITWMLERLKPKVLFGFDPALERESVTIGDSAVLLSRKAAWTSVCECVYMEGGEGSKLAGTGTPEDTLLGRTVPCFDFGSFLQALPEPAVVKMDIEGAEYPILRNLADRKLLGCISELFVEWHGPTMDLDIPWRIWDL